MQDENPPRRIGACGIEGARGRPQAVPDRQRQLARLGAAMRVPWMAMSRQSEMPNAKRDSDDMQSMSMATTDDKSTLRATRLAAGATVLLFGLFFLHVLLRVNPALIYYHQRPVFLTGLGFLKGLLAKPGGPAEYVALFCSQLNYYPWVGALVITLTAGLICLATRGLLRAVANREPHPAAYFIPAILLMLVYSRYEHDQAASVQILAALAFAIMSGGIAVM